MSDALVEHLAAGTGRREGLPDDDSSPLVQAILSRDAGRELSLLLALGARAIERKAGATPAREIARPPPAPPDDRPTSRPGAARLLGEMLSGPQEALLPEALEREARAGRRLPHALLALALGATKREIREALKPVLGARGVWLAGLDPSFAWAVEAPPTVDALATIWTEGGARADALARARAIDPGAARGWLESTWASEKVDDRTLFVHALAIGLSDADEPFLEAALDDRSTRVRNAAQELLAKLPSSRFVTRMRARAASVVKRTKTGLQLGDPPADPRDGLMPGEELRSQRITRMIEAIPLGDLAFDASPTERAAFPRKLHEGAALAEGWTRAAARERDPIWAEALWDFWIAATQKTADEGQVRASLIALMPVLPPEKAVERMLQVLDRGAEDRPVAALLLAMPRPWPTPLTERYLAAVARAEDDTDPRATELMQALPYAVRAIAPEDLVPAEKLLPERGGVGPWRHALTLALNLIAVRREILEETRP